MTAFYTATHTANYISKVPGRLWSSFGRGSNAYSGGFLYMDNASEKIFHHCQVSLRTGETLRGKMPLELMAHESGFSIKQ